VKEEEKVKTISWFVHMRKTYQNCDNFYSKSMPDY